MDWGKAATLGHTHTRMESGLWTTNSQQKGSLRPTTKGSWTGPAARLSVKHHGLGPRAPQLQEAVEGPARRPTHRNRRQRPCES